MVLLFVGTLGFGLLPFLLSKCLKKKKISSEKYEKIIGYLNSFAGGVFLGTSVLHLLPEAVEEFEHDISYEYPIAEAITCAGFLLVMFVEQAMIYCSSADSSLHRSHGHNNQSMQNDESPNEVKNQNVFGIESSQNPDTSEKRTDKKSRFRSLIVILALSLHVIFEGIVVGTQNSEDDVWILLGILSLHKCIVAFSVGINIELNISSFKKAFAALFVFSIIAPIGVAIGIVVTETGTGNSHGIAAGVLQSLATGTFLYVTFFEMLQKEVGHGKSILKVICVTIGFLVIVGIQFLPDKD
ncbi:hypothetical protein FSP39_008515 [Pinctada imbricata]|uniref:Uncharacterized protein n=1 Tax=Pinctada imbricata TaxID=66713 RepID=A0AA89BWT2_PINIB|nr:hypothetical protein FSP39_008515 [Pinctada imbricata]